MLSKSDYTTIRVTRELSDWIRDCIKCEPGITVDDYIRDLIRLPRIPECERQGIGRPRAIQEGNKTP
jgi:hypothetical protein